MAENILEIKDLHTSFFTKAGEVKAVSGVTFEMKKGQVIAIVGESGSGKSVTAASIMHLLQHPGKIVSGEIIFDKEVLTDKNEKMMSRIRGKEIGMIFQDPMTSLNPVLTIGKQIIEVLKMHQKMSDKAAKERAIELLELVGFSNVEKRLSQYPHEFSGGMRQRVMIAIALACNPKLLIADEPTTALDVTIQAQIMELMSDLKDRFETSLILITHDLGVVAGMAEKVIVMYAGKIVEMGNVRDVYYDPKHPYTWGLLKAIPRLDYEEKKRLLSIEGQPPDLLHPPTGCAFCNRCKYAMEVCQDNIPDLFEVAPGHVSRCWLQHADAPKVEREVI